MKKPFVFISTAFLLFSLGLSSAFADDSDIFGRNVQPNVLILIDSSGSMADEVPSSTYSPGTTYGVVNKCKVGGKNNQPCTSTVVFQESSGKYTTYAATISAVSSASARTALSTTGYWSGKISGSNVNLFLGNYLNYKLSAAGALQPCSRRTG